jgi:hypothetical protein
MVLVELSAYCQSHVMLGDTSLHSGCLGWLEPPDLLLSLGHSKAYLVTIGYLPPDRLQARRRHDRQFRGRHPVVYQHAWQQRLHGGESSLHGHQDDNKPSLHWTVQKLDSPEALNTLRETNGRQGANFVWFCTDCCVTPAGKTHKNKKNLA